MTVFRKKRISRTLYKGSVSPILGPSVAGCSNHGTIRIRVLNHADKKIGEGDPFFTNNVESWAPLRIPLVLVLTVSFVISLLV